MYNNDILNKGAAKAAERPYYEFGDTLYHYTNLTALNGMLFGKKELWLGEDSFMNDTKELTDFIDKLKTACLDPANQDNQQKYIEFFDKVYAHVKSNYPYIMSFSRRIDDAAQWERYADNARGLCIEFNTYNLAKILYTTNSAAFLEDVFYDYDAHQHEHCKIVKSWIENNEFLEGFSDEDGLIDNIVATASSYKHNSFSAEDEIRAIILFIGSFSKAIRVEYETLNGIVKKYAKIDLTTACKEAGINLQDLFNGIIIGPRSQQNIHTLQEYLINGGYERLANNITVSECPLR